MKTVEVRSLVNDSDLTRTVIVEEHLTDVFKMWYELFVKKTNKEPTLIDVFYAGYILSNPNVRSQYRRLIKQKEIEYKQ